MKTDRLRIVSIGVVAMLVIELGYEIFAHVSPDHGFVITLIIILVALEKIRLEFRDIREAMLQGTLKPER